MVRKMYDSIDPNTIPVDAEMVAGYIDGSVYRWPESSWSRFPRAVKVRIARRTYTNDGHVLDVEANIPTVWPPTSAIVDWVQMRRKAGIEPTIYCNQQNDWPGIRQLFQSVGIKEPNYWVARYNNIQEIPTGAIAKQYANSTLAGGTYDLSVVADYWPGVDSKQGVKDMDPSTPIHVTYPGNRNDGIDRPLSEVIGDPYVYWADALKEGTPWSFVDMLNILKEMRDVIKELSAGNIDYATLAKAVNDDAAKRLAE